MRHLAIVALGACACAAQSDDVTPPVLTAPVVVAPTPVETPEMGICDLYATWVAFQSDGGPWTRASGGPRSFGARIAGRGGIALVYAADPKYREIRVLYGTTSELKAQLSSCGGSSTIGTKAMTGTVAGVADAGAVVRLGDARESLTSNGDYSLRFVGDGPLDLVAHTARDYFAWPTRIIVRRAQNLANGGHIPLLDFAGVEAVPLAAATLTITGIGSGRAVLSSSFSTATTPEIDLVFQTAAAQTQAMYGVPAALAHPGDRYALSVEVTSSSDARLSWVGFRDFVARTIAVGPPVGLPTTNMVATTPYLRPQTRLPSQAEYADGAAVSWEQLPTTGGWILGTVILSRDYLGGRPETWEAIMPDLTAAGFDRAWGFQPGLPIAVEVGAIGGASFARLVSEAQSEEFNVRYAGRIGSPASTSSAATKLRELSLNPGLRSLRRK